MDLTKAVYDLFLIILAAEDKELKYDSPIVIGLRFFAGFFKDQY